MEQYQFLTAKEVMQILRVGRTTLWRLIKKGLLKPVPMPFRGLRFRVDDVAKLTKEVR